MFALFHDDEFFGCYVWDFEDDLPDLSDFYRNAEIETYYVQTVAEELEHLYDDASTNPEDPIGVAHNIRIFEALPPDTPTYYSEYLPPGPKVQCHVWLDDPGKLNMLRAALQHDALLITDDVFELLEYVLTNKEKFNSFKNAVREISEYLED